MHPFPHFQNLHAGRPFVVIGKGPTLDAWLAAGCPSPDCAVWIGVNQVAALVPDVLYSVTGDCQMEHYLHLPTQWFRGVPYMRMNTRVDALPPGTGIPFDAHATLAHGRATRLPQDRDTLARTAQLYCHVCSANPAVHLAWFMGASSLMLVGIDGGIGRAESLLTLPDRPSPPSYDEMKASVQAECDILFGPRWHHWQPAQPIQKPEGELWKYEGIYRAQEQPNSPFCGYGHSNHGQRALPWLLEQGFTSLLDVGCGHNEFIRDWRQQLETRNSKPETSTGVDFACPGADVIAPATALPFGDAAFDVVTSFDMLEHLPEHEVMPALREMRRVSRTAFCFSIATAPSRILWQGQNLHPTVKPLDWWLDRIREAGGEPEVSEGYVRGRWRDRDRKTLRLGEGETRA